MKKKSLENFADESHSDRLIAKLSDKSAVIGIVGLGYVGLPLMLSFIESGYNVIGFDIDEELIQLLSKGESSISHISSERISSAISGGFAATSNFEFASDVDSLIICVPTPLGRHKEPDLSLSFRLQKISCLTCDQDKWSL